MSGQTVLIEVSATLRQNSVYIWRVHVKKLYRNQKNLSNNRKTRLLT